MTDPERLQSLLAWLLHLMADNPRAWWPHCKHRAAEAAAKEPRVFATLPALLSEGLSDLKPTGPDRPSIDQS